MNTLQLIAAAVLLVFLLLVSVVIGQNVFGTGTDFGLSLFERAENWLGFGPGYPDGVDFSGAEVTARFTERQELVVVVNEVRKGTISVSKEDPLKIDLLEYVEGREGAFHPIHVRVYPKNKAPQEGQEAGITGRELLSVEAVVVDFEKIRSLGTLEEPGPLEQVSLTFLADAEYTTFTEVWTAIRTVIPFYDCAVDQDLMEREIRNKGCDDDTSLRECLNGLDSSNNDDALEDLSLELMCMHIGSGLFTKFDEKPVYFRKIDEPVLTQIPNAEDEIEVLGFPYDPLAADRQVRGDDGSIKYGVIYR